MRKTLFAGALGVAAAATVALAPTGSADVGIQSRVYHGDDYASSNGRWVEVCDIERDGNATFGRVDSFRVCEDRSGRPDSCSSWAAP